MTGPPFATTIFDDLPDSVVVEEYVLSCEVISFVCPEHDNNGLKQFFGVLLNILIDYIYT